MELELKLKSEQLSARCQPCEMCKGTENLKLHCVAKHVAIENILEPSSRCQPHAEGKQEQQRVCVCDQWDSD